MTRLAPLLTLVALLASGCEFTLLPAPSGSGGSPTNADAGVAANPYQEVYDNGLLRYVDAPQVVATQINDQALFPNIKVHKFGAAGRGPLCMRGKEYFVETRETDSQDLMVFLEGGGVCLDEICAATAEPMLTLRGFTAGSYAVGIGGLLDPDSPNNPLAGWDVVHAPYCDGSIFAGDVDRILSDGNALNGTQDQAYQRGLLNLTATFVTASRTFPNPRRIALVGSSGGSYGVLLGIAMARHFYPTTPIVIVSDSGGPILSDADPDFIRRVLVEVGAIGLLPSRTCPDCIANGHATGVVEWALARDPNTRFAYMGHAGDHVIGEFFMGTTADEFRTALVRETGRLVDRFPGRAHRFIAPGSRHTLALDVTTLPDQLLKTVLGVFGPLAVTGDDVTSAELQKWVLGGMRETATDASGTPVTGNDWLRTVLDDPAHAENVVQLQ
ncbi:MAG: pectin acetylesterase-family hydrolase [Polyangiales bacterium]